MRKQILALFVLSILTLNIQAQSFKVGDDAPKIVQTNFEGEEFNLESLKGQMVLVDFWASWCLPCRKENPAIIKAYKKYKDAEFKNAKGFTVVSISLDKNRTAWENAIEKDKMEWPYHLSDLKGWRNAIAKELKVKSIPASFLMDGNGKIIAVNLRGKALESKLKKQVKGGSIWGSIWN